MESRSAGLSRSGVSGGFVRCRTAATVRPRSPLGRSAGHTGPPAGPPPVLVRFAAWDRTKWHRTQRLKMTKPQVNPRFCSLLLVSEGGLEPVEPPRSRRVSGLLSADPLRFARFRDHRSARCATWGRTDFSLVVAILRPRGNTTTFQVLNSFASGPSGSSRSTSPQTCSREIRGRYRQHDLAFAGRRRGN
jgi:hypothetical protein